MLDSFIFAVNAVLPIVLMVVIGYILKRVGFIDGEFVKKGNKLVFRIFLPAMLFLNVYNIKSFDIIDYGFILYAPLATVAFFLVGLLVVTLVTKDDGRRGALLQGTFRSNYALIGIPLAGSLFGSEGEAVASLLSAALIPTFNILAVISLSIFRRDGGKASVKSVLLGILKNPLIGAIFAGLLTLGIRALFVHFGVEFRLSDVTPVYKVLEYLKNLATPLALVLLGAQFEFSAIGYLKREIITGVLLRCLFVPFVGLAAAYLFFGKSFGGAEFAALIAAFASPIAVSSVPMAQEMGSDTTLAGQLVVFTTLFSTLSIFLASFAFSLLGVFV